MIKVPLLRCCKCPARRVIVVVPRLHTLVGLPMHVILGNLLALYYKSQFPERKLPHLPSPVVSEVSGVFNSGV